MKRSDTDFSAIKFSSMIFIIVLLSSVGVTAASWFFKESMLAQYNRQKLQFTTISQQYLSVGEDKATIKQHYPAFADLYRQGIIGPEHRLNWVETLRLASEKIKLPSLTYNISPLQRYLPTFSIELGNLLLYSSTMQLNIGMLHEGDLLQLIDSLNEHAIGIFTLQECHLLRTAEKLIEQPDGVNIKADCRLQWFNIRHTDGTEIRLS